MKIHSAASVSDFFKSITKDKEPLFYEAYPGSINTIGVRHQCGQPSVNLRQVPGQSNGQWCEIGKRGK